MIANTRFVESNDEKFPTSTPAQFPFPSTCSGLVRWSFQLLHLVMVPAEIHGAKLLTALTDPDYHRHSHFYRAIQDTGTSLPGVILDVQEKS